MLKPFRVLALAGGGVRGIFQARYLRRLDEALKTATGKSLRESPGEHLELIAGTSTGALVALAVAFGKDLEAVANLYTNISKRIFNLGFFSKARGLGRLWHHGAVYDSSLLQAELTKLFPNKQLKQAQVPVLITATKLDQFGHRLFNSKDAEDGELAVVDVAMASCAVPLGFRPVTVGGDGCSYLDGGLWANSPVLAAIATAVSQGEEGGGVAASQLRVLCVGNGRVPLGATGADFLRSRLGLGTDLLGLSFAAQERGAEDLSRRLLSRKQVVLVNTSLTKSIPLNDTESIEWLGNQTANYEVQETISAAVEILDPRQRVEDDQLASIRQSYQSATEAAEIFYEQIARPAMGGGRTAGASLKYYITAGFDAEITRVLRLRSVEKPIRYLAFNITAPDASCALDSYLDLSLKVSEPGVLFVMGDTPLRKRFLLVLFNPVEVGSERSITTTYQWPRMMKPLCEFAKDEMKLQYPSPTPDATFRFEVYLDPTTGGGLQVIPEADLKRLTTVQEARSECSRNWPGYVGETTPLSGTSFRIQLKLSKPKP